MIAALAMALAAAAAPPSAPKEVSVADGFLVTKSGAPLYTYANDTMVGMSHCGGECARAYPPLIASSDAQPLGDWTLVGREDGSHQWAFHDKPLYTSVKPAADIAKAEAEGGNWRRARSGGAVEVAAMMSEGSGPSTVRLARDGSSQFTCEGDRRLLAQFVSRDSHSTAIVDAGDGAHALALMPWAGGDPQVSWSDGTRTLVWTAGVKLMWMDGPSHLACGRAAHHH